VLLSNKAKSLSGVEQWPYKAVAEALEVIPRTLVQNCGGNAIKTLTQLRVCVISLLYLFKEPKKLITILRPSTLKDIIPGVSMERQDLLLT
jgi:chaperonin GroEL (HSP60 family)